jgi:signal transduction histidine kinase
VPAGEGIGLSIVKRLCELLDASLELETAPGAGTTFRVVLPRAYPEDEQQQA